MAEPPDSASDPFAGYTPVKMAHPVVDTDVPELAPMPRRGRRRSHCPRWLMKPLRTLRSLVFWLCMSTAVTTIGVIAYGWFYGRPLSDEIPELAFCVREANALSDWGRTLRTRFDEAIASRRGARRKSSEDTPTQAVGQAVEHAKSLGAERRQRLRNAQRFADGIATDSE